MSRTVLLTGGLGQIGLFLIPLLQAKGWRIIYLIRDKDGVSAEERLAKVVEIRPGLDIVIRGDLEKRPLAEIPESILQEWKGKIDMVIHFAAVIKFAQNLSNSVMSANITMTEVAIEIADRLDIPKFHLGSTLYVCGKFSKKIFNETDYGSKRRKNSYETSKRVSEDFIRNSFSGTWSIYRLPILIGSSQTGEISDFTGYYGAFLPFWHLREYILKTWQRKKDLYKSKGLVYNFDSDLLTIPMWVKYDGDAALNIVPIDFVAEAISQLLDVPCNNEVYHIAHQSPPKLSWLIDTTFNILGIKPAWYDDGSGKDIQLPLSSFVKIVDPILSVFIDYINGEPLFKDSGHSRARGDNYVPFPKITKDLLDIELSYAKSMSFGRDI